MIQTRSIGRLVLILAAGAVLLALLALRTAPPTPQSTIGSTPSGAPADPKFTPIPLASTDTTTAECASKAYVVKQVYADRADPTLANRTEGSTLVVIGTATVGKARWNSDSGVKPAVDTAGNLPSAAMIYQPVDISVEDTLRGKADTADINVRWLGGQVGCEIAGIDAGTDIDVKDGARYAFFLGPALNIDGKRSTTDLTIQEAWPVASDGSIKTPLEGTIQKTDFATRVDAAPVSPMLAP